ncbi:PTS sugar transporter subunit IIC [Photobacterium profundum]|uniref:protein-N(pi)-phosphohistidine--D-fructose phosphotransferase n=1 Tax=Photobacterium profundum 3TCK TaxID=314280 RepID=Q1ZB42_9GAMM|nr:PTS fructose transporter subunit IIB [Photobacterium profundum]EAS45300.1 protein modification enzyme, induction of ompC [Photobacterium profundum 3TCK]PSV63505.1 PTS sugar transporter subunit IIC [Photobacterium profundum]
MYIVCVAACPTGVAHTFMAAEALEIKGKELGIEIKVETQGSMGADNIISMMDIERADAAILAADVAINDVERFSGLPKIECSVADPIKHGDALFAALKQEVL